MKRQILFGLLVLMLAAGVTSAQDEIFTGQFDGPGTYTIGFLVQGVERQVRILIPDNYDENAPTPLVFVLHGAGGTGAGIASWSGFDDLAQEEGFIVVYPDGINHGWNDARLDVNTLVIDDVGFIGGLIDLMTASLNIDPQRIYSTGYSMGGMMSYRLGCQLQDRIAAIASVASTFPGYQLDSCVFANPVPVMIIQGTGDPVVPYQGFRDRFGNRAYLSAEESLRYWAEQNFCQDDVMSSSLPDVDTEDQTRVRLEGHTDCAGDADVMLYAVRGGGHTWPGHPIETDFELGRTTMDMDATRVIWEFFKSHPKS